MIASEQLRGSPGAGHPLVIYTLVFIHGTKLTRRLLGPKSGRFVPEFGHFTEIQRVGGTIFGGSAGQFSDPLEKRQFRVELSFFDLLPNGFLVLVSSYAHAAKHRA